MSTIKIKSSKLKATKWRVGEIVEERRPFFKQHQYEIVDFESGMVTLQQLASNERVKPEFLTTIIE